MLTGALSTVEKIFWAIVWLLFLLIVAFALLGWLQNAAGGNPLGKVAQWINDRARPQAS